MFAMFSKVVFMVALIKKSQIYIILSYEQFNFKSSHAMLGLARLGVCRSC